MHLHLRTAGITAVVAAAVVLCPQQASMLAAPQKPATATADPRVPVWPLPPEPPRIRYLTSHMGLNDFKTTKKRGLLSRLLGDNEGGQTAETLVKPYGIGVSATGVVYVTDTAARHVFVFDSAAKTVSFLGGSGAGKVTKPTGIAVDADGRIFIADASLNRVFGFAPDGTLVFAIGREGELKSPSGLAIDKERELLYVVDSAMHQVLCYSTVDGVRVHTIGSRGSDPGTFNFPTNAFVDRLGRLYVADTLNFRVQIFEADGKFLHMFGVQGDRPGTFNRPKGLAVDSEGHIYVADTSFNNFQIFDQEGALLLSVGSGGREAGEFQLPAGLFIDTQDRIYVADQGNSRVQVFQYLRAGSK